MRQFKQSQNVNQFQLSFLTLLLLLFSFNFVQNRAIVRYGREFLNSENQPQLVQWKKMFCYEPPDARIVGPVKILLRPKLVKRDKKCCLSFGERA